MPYKNKEKATEASKLRMQKMRQGVTQQGVTDEGVTWETIPLEDIKEILPSDIITDILRINEYDRIRHSPISLELRLRRAYKYHLWHAKNFINGVHKDLLEATK